MTMLKSNQMKTKAVALLRVSSDKQGMEGDSVERQKEEISKTLVGKYNAPVVKWFELTQSATKEIHPATQVIEFCKSNPDIAYCFVTYIDRFTRSGSYWYQHLKAQLAKYGVQLVDLGGVISTKSVNTLESLGKEYNWSTYSPSLTAEILEAESSRDEIRKILTRLIGSEIRYMRMGYWCARIPEGYLTESAETDNGKRCVLKPDPLTSAHFLRMFELKIQGLPDQDIVRRINSLGYKSRRLNRRDENNKVVGYKGQVQLTVKQLNKFISNPIYALISTHKWLEKPSLMRGTPIVSIAMFNKANRGKIAIVNDDNQIQVLRGEKLERFTRKCKINPLYPYKQYVLCPQCSYKLKGSASTGKLGKKHPAYHCSLGHPSFRVRLKDFNETIESFVTRVNFSDEFKKKLASITLEELQKRITSTAKDSVLSDKTVSQLKSEKQMIVDTFKNLSSPVAIKALEEELEKVEFKLLEATQERDNKEDEQLNLETLFNHCKYYIEHLEELILGGTDPIQNAAFFGLIFDKLPTYEELKHGTPSLAPLFKLNEAYDSQKDLSVDAEFLNWNTLQSHLNRIHSTFQQYNFAIM